MTQRLALSSSPSNLLRPSLPAGPNKAKPVATATAAAQRRPERKGKAPAGSMSEADFDFLMEGEAEEPTPGMVRGKGAGLLHVGQGLAVFVCTVVALQGLVP